MIIPLSLGLLKVNICLFSLYSLVSHLGPLNIFVIMLWTCSRLYIYTFLELNGATSVFQHFTHGRVLFHLSFQYPFYYYAAFDDIGDCVVHGPVSLQEVLMTIRCLPWHLTFIWIYLNVEPILLQIELGLLLSIFIYKCYKFTCPVEELFCVRLFFVINPFIQ